MVMWMGCVNGGGGDADEGEWCSEWARWVCERGIKWWRGGIKWRNLDWTLFCRSSQPPLGVDFDESSAGRLAPRL